MSRDDIQQQVHHDLRGVLSAVQLNLHTLEALEADAADVTPEKRLAIVQRAKAALAQAVKLVDRLNAEGLDSSAGRN